MNKLKTLIIFSAGIGIGAFVTWRFLRPGYEEEENDTLTSEHTDEKTSINNDTDDVVLEAASHAKEKPDIATYAKKLQEAGYVDYTSMGKKDNVTSESDSIDNPYAIPPEEYGDLEGYRQIELTYYSDGTLADDNDEIVDDVADIIGNDALNHFGEFEDDSVFIRNDRLKCDYQILLDNRAYSDVYRI